MIKIKLNDVTLNYFYIITKTNLNSKYICNMYGDMKKRKLLKKISTAE